MHKISKELKSNLYRDRSLKSLVIPFTLTGALWVDNYSWYYRRSNRIGRWSWWPQQWHPRISENYQSNQEIVWVYLLRTFVTVLMKSYYSSPTWATSVLSLNSHTTSSISPAIYLPIYAFSRLHQCQGLLECVTVYFDRRSLRFQRNILLPLLG